MSGGGDNAAGILRYLASCYRENSSRAGVTSLDSSRVHASLILQGRDEIVSDSLLEGQLFVPGSKAADIATKAKLYEKDRELFYGSVFLMGKLEGEDARRKPAFAPLLLYSVSVSEVMEGGAEFLIDTSRSLLNYALLESLGDGDFLSNVEDAVSSDGHTEACVAELRRVLEGQIPDLHSECCLEYPNLLCSRELRQVFTALEGQSGKLALASGSVLFLSEKSSEMRGVLNDLEEMADGDGPLSGPFKALLGIQGGNAYRGQKRQFSGHLPAILSDAQSQVLASSRTHALTLAVGPPGTGKSFTIAALAIEAMSRGESVLIASKMDHAVDVVADKIEQSLDLKGVCVRAGRRNYLKQLKSFLENLLSGLFTRSDVTGKGVKKHAKELSDLTRRIERTEIALEKRCEREERWGDILSDPDPGFFTRWRQRRIRKHVETDTIAANVADQIGQLISGRTGQTVAYLKEVRSFYLSGALSRHRSTFQAFSKGIRARTSHKKEEYFANVDWEGLLTALPIWLTKLSDLHRVIPLKNELFDLVIIDEASQCDIASALPALARAKRAVITGDPKQLRHISFLPIARQKELAEFNELSSEQAEVFNFRNVSLVDLLSGRIANQKQVVFLNEHFRSRPEIIGFSNREFYAERLAIMTGHREVDRHGGTALSVYDVSGLRRENGVNEAEIDAVLKQVFEFTKPSPVLTVGILCPFRAQVEAFQNRVEQSDLALTLLERNQLLIGTSHSFQGEERDIMFLSFAVDDKSPAASFRFLEREDVFNVAITRARLENRIFVSFSSAAKGRGLVSRFLEYARSVESGKPNRVESSIQSSLLTPEVQGLISALEENGLEVRPRFTVGGYQVDLLCSRGERSIGIDVIGFPGSMAEALTLERHLTLRRAGIRLFPLTLAEWTVKREAMVGEILRWMGE
ncbi:MAG: ATP-binding protein [Verrucomicrobiales bacterium]|nr:ATP-binding protein [Verrucomicrobiales bacterium]